MEFIVSSFVVLTILEQVDVVTIHQQVVGLDPTNLTLLIIGNLFELVFVWCFKDLLTVIVKGFVWHGLVTEHFPAVCLLVYDPLDLLLVYAFEITTEAFFNIVKFIKKVELFFDEREVSFKQLNYRLENSTNHYEHKE